MHRKSRLTLVMMAVLLMVGMVGIQPAKPVQAALPTDLFFSEYIEGNGYNKAVEIYNGTGMPVDLSDYRLELYSNGAPAPGGATVVLSGELASGDVFVVSRSDADPTIVAQADLLNSTVANWTGDDAIALRKISTNSFVDVFGQIGFDPGSYWGTIPIITQDRTLVRKTDICAGDPDGSNAFDPVTEWDWYLMNTFTYIGSHTSSCAPNLPTINEFSASTAGTDVEFIEFFGSPNTDYGAYTLLGIEGDANTTNSSEGFVDNLIPLGTTDANGFFLVNLEANTFENGTLSLLLVKDNTATSGVDIDTDDNGVIDMTYWSEITDGVAVNDGGSGDLTYATPVLGVAYDGFPFAPGGASRIPDGTDTDTTSDWVRNDFDLAGIPDYPGTIAAGEAYNTPGASNQVYVETAPSVIGTIPANGANHPNDENITITFSEPVDVTNPWFSIACDSSGTHTATVTDADPVYTLNPTVDFTIGESCTVTITAANVVDDDTDDATYNAMLADYTFSFTAVTPPERCGDAFTHTYEIQGTTETSPLSGTVLATEGVVVGDFQVGGKNGYYIQDPTGDGDTTTSDGIFVYNTSTAVNVGDHVRVRGTAVEYYGMTEISPVTQVWICSTGNAITPTEVTLPVTAVSDFERYEGMLVTFPQSLIISEYFNFDRYGEIVLTSTRHMTPTAFVEPGTPAQAEAAAYLLDRITLDDGRTAQNPDPAIHPNGQIFNMSNLFRGGGTVTDATGILDFYQGLYRVQPTTGAVYQDANPRTAAPEITEADLKVASFNVLNYFVTLDGGTSAWICGPTGDMECRGADNAEEFGRQRAKILAALDAIDADVFGLMEIENEHPGGDDAVADLVAGLNAINGEGTYAYIETGAIGGDAIKQAILYKPTSVTPMGLYKILDSSVDARFIDTANRPVLAQVFRDNETGDEFVVAVNHLKSKGSPCTGDPDTGDGQGNCNQTRKAAAQALVDWLANPAYFPDVEKDLIIGDLNSYDKEDPIDMIKLGSDDAADTDDDYLDMIFEKRGENAYGYVYDGQTGYLDHALADQAMAESIVDVNFWHINADEPDLIDYDTSFKLPAQDALYAPDAYRSSDHDPVIITLDMNAFPVAQDQEVTTPEDTPVVVTLTATDLEGAELTYAIATEPAHGEVDLTGNLATYTPAINYFGEDSFTFKANDGHADSAPATVTVNVTPVQDAPIAYDQDDVTTPEDTVLEITLVATDVDGDTLAYAIVDEPTHGEVELLDNIATYTPALNYFGEDSFTFKANDGTVDSNVATITTMTTAVNDAPIAQDRSTTTLEETPVGVTLAATDIDGDELTYAIVTQPVHGTVTLVGNIATYTPALNYFGEDSFTFKANDGLADSDPATVTITVTNVKDQVEAVDDSYATNEDTALTIAAPGVLANDIDVDNNIRAASLVTDVQHGTLSLLGDGSFTYVPDPDFTGTDTFIYQLVTHLAPQSLWADEATVTITVSPVDDAPVLGLIQDATIPELVGFSFTAMATDVDLPAQVLTFSLVGAPESAAITEAGVFTWTPSEEQGAGVYTFTVKVCDDTDPTPLCDEQEVTLTVTEVNAAPVAQDLTAITSEDTPVNATLLATDAENDSLIYAIVAQPAHGTVTLAGTTATYTPDLDYTGPDSFTYKANDGAADSEIAVVTITVTPVNDAPVAVEDAYSTNEDTALTVLVVDGVLANDSDVDGDELIAILVDSPTNGTLSLALDGSFVYTPDENFIGTDSFTYYALDREAESVVTTVTLTINPINDWPIANDDFYEVLTGTELVKGAAEGVLANDVLLDPDEEVSIQILDGPQHGTLSMNDDGSFTYIPDAGYMGRDTFRYMVLSVRTVNAAWSDDATVTITVEPLMRLFLPIILR